MELRRFGLGRPGPDLARRVVRPLGRHFFRRDEDLRKKAQRDGDAARVGGDDAALEQVVRGRPEHQQSEAAVVRRAAVERMDAADADVEDVPHAHAVPDVREHASRVLGLYATADRGRRREAEARGPDADRVAHLREHEHRRARASARSDAAPLGRASARGGSPLSAVARALACSLARLKILRGHVAQRSYASTRLVDRAHTRRGQHGQLSGL
mmetsp:Transcript_7344/g.21617  ORF Transcript_7344/g.21617 Transcript_7344/m.21617 type:complete len:213 (+) Transcript_7344:391-1029(+)